MKQEFAEKSLPPNSPIYRENTAVMLIDITRHCLQFFKPDEIEEIRSRTEDFLDKSGLRAAFFYTPNEQLEDEDLEKTLKGIKVPNNHILKQRPVWPAHSGERLVSFLEYKKFEDCFLQTEIDAFLRNRGIDTVVIIGVEKPLCAWKSALGAAAHGYRTFFIDDLTFVSEPIKNGQRNFEITSEIATDNNITLTTSDALIQRIQNRNPKNPGITASVGSSAPSLHNY